MEYISTLPNETLLHIFSFCNKEPMEIDVENTWTPFTKNESKGPDPVTMGKVSLVCKKWSELASDNFLWKEIIEKHEIPVDLYHAQFGLTLFDRARQSQIELNEEHHSQIGKGDEEAQFGKVAAGQKASNQTAHGIADSENNSLKNRVKEFVDVFCAFPNYHLFENIMDAKERGYIDLHEFVGAEQQFEDGDQAYTKGYQTAPTKTKFQRALKRYRSLYPITQALKSNILVPLMKMPQFKGFDRDDEPLVKPQEESFFISFSLKHANLEKSSFLVSDIYRKNVVGIHFFSKIFRRPCAIYVKIKKFQTIEEFESEIRNKRKNC